MSQIVPTVDLAQSFDSFGPFLRYLRKRARLTQRDLGVAVGYSIAQISLLENGLRLPELATIAALFVPALDLQSEPEVVARLLHLAATARGVDRMTITRTVHRELTLQEVEVTPPSNLPASLTSFIGRERELDSVRRMLTNSTTRLITLLGPPGVGKTRLALQLAWDVQQHGDFENGVWFVDLAAIREPQFVAAAIRQSFGITESPSRGSEGNTLRKYLRDQHLFLVLDNFEQVLSAAPLVTDLLTAAPRLKILITSREALDLYGEHEYPVPPLPLPDLAALPALDDLARIPSAALFIERAQTVKSDFQLTPTNALAVAAICARLDGLPLALELAAVQIKRMEPAELAAHLVHRLKVLEWKALPHHQTLRMAIDWSFELLTDAEQKLFRRLAVFAGSFSLEEVQTICTDRGAMYEVVCEREAADLLSHLVDKSLVMIDSQYDVPRYRLLETIREYASEKLDQSGDKARQHHRHLKFFTNLAENAEDRLTGVEQKIWLDRLEMEYDNFRAALQRSFDSDDNDLGLRLAATLFRFWWIRGHHTNEGRYWLERTLAAKAPVPSLTRARALRGLAGLELNQGEFDAAGLHYRECLEIFQQIGDETGSAIVMANLGNALRLVGNYADAKAYLRASLEKHQKSKTLFYVGYCLWSLAGIAYEEKDYAHAQTLNEQALSFFRKVGNQQYAAGVMAQLGMIATVAGDYKKSSTLFRDALGLLRELKDQMGILQVLEALAYHALREEEPQRAATLLGAIESARTASGISWHLFDSEYRTTVAQVHTMLDPETLEFAYREGRAMMLEQAMDYALAT